MMLYQIILTVFLWNVTKLFAAHIPFELLRFPYCHCTLPGSMAHQDIAVLKMLENLLL